MTHSGCILESLESRQLLTAYGLQALLGYDRLGAWTRYAQDYTVTTTSNGTRSLHDTLTMKVAKQLVTYDGHKSNLMTATWSATPISLSQAWYTDKAGVHLGAMINTNQFGKFTMNAHNTTIAPRAMVVGQLYKDTGTFDGTFKATIQGYQVNGTIQGTMATSSQLLGPSAVKVPAGTFTKAMKGLYNITASGTIRISVAGHTYTGKFSEKVPETFWAVAGKGIVKANYNGLTISISMEGEKETTSMIGSMAMTSSGLSQAPARSSPAPSAATEPAAGSPRLLAELLR